MQRFLLCIITFFLLIWCSFAYAVEHHTESWTTGQFVGSITPDNKFHYYLQPQINFIDRENKFQTAFLLLGAGYQPSRDLMLWLMIGEAESKNAQNNGQQVHIIRQQLDWHAWETNPQNFVDTAWSSVTRLEERKQAQSSQWQVRLRERVTFRTPIPHWKDHSFVTFDEAFFNFTQPTWISSNTFLQQNRLFFGVGSVFKKFAFDLGYLNQYQWNYTRQMNNVIFLVFYANLDQAFLSSPPDKSLPNFGKLKPQMNT